MCSAVWNGCSLQCQHAVKLSHPSHTDPLFFVFFFSEMCAWTENRHLSPRGASNATNQMWTKKNYAKRYETSPKPCWWGHWIKMFKVQQKTPPIFVRGLKKPAVLSFSFIVCIWFAFKKACSDKTIFSLFQRFFFFLLIWHMLTETHMHKHKFLTLDKFDWGGSETLLLLTQKNHVPFNSMANTISAITLRWSLQIRAD